MPALPVSARHLLMESPLGCFGQWPIASGFGSMLDRELEESVDSDASNIESNKPSRCCNTTEEAFTIPQTVH